MLPPGYNDGHRLFLQSIMAHGSITFSQAQTIAARISSSLGTVQTPEETPLEAIEHIVNTVGRAIALHDYQIRTSIDQRTGERVWAWVNTQSDPATQMATTLTPDELSFVKRVLDAIFDTYNSQRMEKMCVTKAEVLKLSHPPRNRPRPSSDAASSGADPAALAQQMAPSADKGLRHSDVERVIRDLISGGWFEQSKEKFLTLSPRGLMELQNWLFASYNDPDVAEGGWQRIKKCEQCKEIVSWGQRCSVWTCIVRLHDGCADKLWQARRNHTCPRCNTEWSGDKFVGERAITSSRIYRDAKDRRATMDTVARDIFNAATRDDNEEDDESE